jgi:hypothetical protein
MARRLPLLGLTLLVSIALPARAIDPRGVLVSYSFEGESPATGPDTFAVFDHARGRVELSYEMALSGWASVRVEDAAGDGDFPELQGYFPVRSSGRLFVHFALLVTDSEEELNVALAGPAGFRLGRDGIVFWLRVLDGELRHVSDSVPQRLLAVRPFVWYGVDVAFDVDEGLYDLTVREEGLSEPVVELRGVPSAASAPASAVDKFSFIGDLPNRDRSRVVYFVDDVLVGVDESILQVPFVAPGRRRLFFDRCWRSREAAQPASPCPMGAAGGAADAAGLDFERLMGADRFQEALAIAEEKLIGGEPGRDDRSVWHERAAAAAHFLGLESDAEEHLEAALSDAPDRFSILVALADLAHLRGDLAGEARFREAVYGSLAPDR